MLTLLLPIGRLGSFPRTTCRQSSVSGPVMRIASYRKEGGSRPGVTALFGGCRAGYPPATAPENN